MTSARMRRTIGTLLAVALALALAVATASAAEPQTGRGSAPDRSALLAELGSKRVARHAATGYVRFVSGTLADPAATNTDLGRPGSPQAAARRFMDRYGSLFGIRDPSASLRVDRLSEIADRTFVRYQQVERGVPVLGALLTLQVDAGGNVISANGEASARVAIDLRPTVTAEAARVRALQAVRDGTANADLQVSMPELWVYDPELLGGRAIPATRLVWRMDVRNAMGDIDEFVLIDAHLGVVVLRFDQIAHAKNRQVCDAANANAKVPCTAPFARAEGGPAHAIVDVNNAYKFAGEAYDFYLNRFRRDSVDDAGLTLKSTVRFCQSACPYQNAFWNGAQMVYGLGFANADDVVGHELTHAVTQSTSRLFYYQQSGAINEALSDIFGEFLDLTNSSGTDTSASRWLLAEDLSGGAIRDMESPPTYGHPDRMTSSAYFADPTESDSGGVHFNSGVANKAAFLMTDGAAFNGQTVTGIGIDKAAAVWYRVQTAYLGSASDYADLGSALNQACSDLVGSTPKTGTGAPSPTGSVTTANCAEVGQAVTATEMSLQPTAAPAPEAPVCTSGSASNIFFDNLENTSSGNWTIGLGSGLNHWYYPQNSHSFTGFDATYATSGDANIWGYDHGATSDSFIRMTNGVTLPTNAFLHFKHAYTFVDGSEYQQPDTRKYDGGVLEYSTSGSGGPWVDAGALITHNGYNGTIFKGFSNPLGGRQAFTAESNGYISSRLNLASLSGQTVRFRFRIGSDINSSNLGWFIDDVRIYTCTSTTTRQPDGRVRLGTSGAFTGNNVYNTTGVGQKKTGSAPVGSTVTFNISIQNDGSANDNFKVLAAGSSTTYNVKYLDGLANVTAQVVAGTYQTPSLAPGATRVLTVKIKVKSGAAVGSKVNRLVTITSVADGTKIDAVKVTVKRS